MKNLQTYASSFSGSRKDLAEAFGISQPHLSLLIAGKKRPSLDLAIRIEQVSKGAIPAISWSKDTCNQEVAQ